MRDITLLHPRLQKLAKNLVAEAAKQGLAIKVTETFRTVAEQDALYAKGRTTPGSIVTNAKGSTYSSMHQWGIAFDICRNDGKGAYNTDGNFFQKVGKIGQDLGMEWGGAWTRFVDLCHFQLPDWGSGPSYLKQTYGTVDKFQPTWTEDEDGNKAHVSYQGWDEDTSEFGAVLGKKGYGLEGILFDTEGHEVTAEVHASNLGDLPVVKGTGTIMIGTEGQSAPMEKIKLFCPDRPLVYRVHYLKENKWSDWTWNGIAVGSTGKAKFIDLIQIAWGN